MGPAGTTLVIIKDSLLAEMNKNVPSMLSYATHADKGSMFNTPPVFAVYTSMFTLEWLKEKEESSAIQEHNETKAKLIYNEIDRNSAFEGFAAKEDRSFMNATFNLAAGLTALNSMKCGTQVTSADLKVTALLEVTAPQSTMPYLSKVPSNWWT